LGEPFEVLVADYHLSYPFVFEWRGEVYLLPETSRNRTIELYRAVEFPRRWEKAAVLMQDVSAVDSTLLEYRGRLWLFTAGIGGPSLKNSELSLFHADSLWGPWYPHPQNPVVCDVRRARPAGSLFYDGGHLIRPAQDCTTRYGAAIMLNRVEVLSDTEYREVPVGMIRPGWRKEVFTTHTINRNDVFEVLDGQARVLRPSLAGLLFGTSGCCATTAAKRQACFQTHKRPCPTPILVAGSPHQNHPVGR
jgi:hypothetical protein